MLMQLSAGKTTWTWFCQLVLSGLMAWERSKDCLDEVPDTGAAEPLKGQMLAP